MSKHETPMLLEYWKQTGGVLIEEFLAVKKTSTNSRRLIDGIIILGEETRMGNCDDQELINGREIIVVQVKASRLGMYLMGQTLFSMRLMEKFNPSKITSVALCRYGDSIMRPLLEKHEGCKVVII